MNNKLKKFLSHVGVIALFAILAAMFFSPAVFDGKELVAGDQEKAAGMTKEMSDYQNATGEGMTWTGAMFAGMPTYMNATPKGGADYLFDVAKTVFYGMGKNHAGIIFTSLVGMYLLLVVMGCGRTVSFFGAVAFAFSSYFIIILPAGHVWKAWAMSWMPFVLLGMLLLYHRKWLLGAVTFAASLSLELSSNHIQITYYLAILCAVLYVCYAVERYLKKELKTLLLATGLLAGGAVVAVLANASRLSSGMEMSQVSTRAPSRLSSTVDGKTDKSSGLDQDYAFAWSYGGSEMMTLIVPNAFGGESGGVLDSRESNMAQAMRKNGMQVPSTLRMPTYWGDQPFTSGPVYLGAIVCFLALLSLFIVRNKYNWTLFGASIFFMLLSMGNNAMWINDFLFHHLPMYNKFRTPSMALVIPQITFAIMACLALLKIAKADYDADMLKKGLLFSAGICFVLIFGAVFFLSYQCQADLNYAQYGAWFIEALKADRFDLAFGDAVRSSVFIAIAAGILFLIMKNRESDTMRVWGMVGIACLSFFDLWGVAQRYCSDDNYMYKREYQPYQPSVADQEILKDKDISYRVLTFNNPFNDTHIPYFHKSIGGYSAVKLRDYQDLIEQHIEPEMCYIQGSFRNIRSLRDIDSVFQGTPVLNMLNMRYLIYNEGAAPLRNNKALGNAWFVKNYVVQNDTVIGADKYTAADLQMRMLGTVNLAETALVEGQFASELAGKKLIRTEGDAIELQSYSPIELVYKTKTAADALAVFSEIYYPLAWVATIDGKPASHFRTDWLLRGMVVPAGEHTIVFRCEAHSYWTLRNMGSIISLLLLLALLGVIGYSAYGYFKKEENA